MRVVLDAGPIGLLSHPQPPDRVWEWADGLLDRGDTILLPEIVDYEIRRELRRITADAGIARLDQLGLAFEYLPLTTSAMRRAAILWADARRRGRPTAPDPALDVDVILAAQALTLRQDDGVVVATTNPSHLRRYVPAEIWSTI